MNKFELGQQVIALTNPEDDLCQSRVKGNIYTVTHIQYCPELGSQSININNQQIDLLEYSNMIECDCGQEHPNYGLDYTESKYFAPLTEESIELLIEQEEYELCEIIKNHLKQNVDEINS